ncbi:MAG TPA: tRNA (adenosine(37)-N6)-dimethylallyltransferase MiaA [Anaeromyxobacteraceae bacterium]|nr:tRNA (adenosine(37)-N6)-dimethylallyltransferase MiaA [Anaeromyxobacteraceae bacterium]
MRIAVIAGPTASGKTRLAIDLCRAAGGEVVNADSQQVYLGLDVGTAKATAAERAEVPHHLLDLCQPGEGMDAARFCALADAAIAEVADRGRLPVVVGGTGLYLRLLLHGVAPAPGRDPGLRARLEEEAARLGRESMHRRLAGVDPEAARRIRPNDLVRVVRALEIAAGGRTQSALFAAHGFQAERYRARLWALEPQREELHRRIDARVEAMFAGGILDEARRLLERSGGRPPPKLPIGYAEAIACVRGELPLKEAVRRVQVAHRRYARRQLTWLRKERGVEWLRPPYDAAALAIETRGA